MANLLLLTADRVIAQLWFTEDGPTPEPPPGGSVMPWEQAAGVGWVWNGVEFVRPAPKPNYDAATQGVLDRFARTWGYDSAASAVSYVGDPNPQFNAEGVAIRDWRSAVWVQVPIILVANPGISITDFLALLPAAPPRPNS